LNFPTQKVQVVKKNSSVIKLFQIIFLLLIAFIIGFKYNIANLILDNIEYFSLGNPIINVYAYNFVSYYSNMETERNVLDALGGISIYTLIIIFLYIYRNRWFNVMTEPILINYIAGLILFLILYSIPHLSGRIFQLFYIPTFIFLFGIIAAQKKKPLNTLPFILLIGLWKFIGTLISETGPYVFGEFL
jgi:hypothetical protein